MSLASPESFTGIDEGEQKTYAYFDQDGKFIDTFTVPVDVFDVNHTLAYGVNERKFTIYGVAKGALQFPDGEKSHYTKEGFDGQLGEAIAQSGITDEELSLKSIERAISKGLGE